MLSKSKITAVFSAVLLIATLSSATEKPDGLVYIEDPSLEQALTVARDAGLPLYLKLEEGIVVGGSQRDADLTARKGVRAKYLGEYADKKYFLITSKGQYKDEGLSKLGTVLLATKTAAVIAVDGEIKRSLLPFGAIAIPLPESPLPNPPLPKFSGKGLTYDPAIATLVSQIDTASVRNYLLRLQSMGTRFLLAGNRFAVAESIKQWFIDMGVSDVKLDTFYTNHYDPWSNNMQVNVVATIPGTSDTSSAIIVGGHHDSYSGDPYNIAPGVDDNGTGTVAALEMARILAANPPEQTVRCMTFAAEEYGLYGSFHYAYQAAQSGENISAMFNYDMIGHYTNTTTYKVFRYSGAEYLGDMLGQATQLYTNLTPIYETGGYGSDSYAFWAYGFPATWGFETTFSTVYHSVRDSITYVSVPYCTEVIRAGLAAVATLANYPQRVNDVILTDIGTGTELAVQWTPNIAANIVGYKIYYGYTSGSYVYNQYTTSLSDTISGLISNVNCYITVRAVDSDGKESPIASEAIGIPVLLTLDQGILIVDETQNWTSGSFPQDTTQDNYYRDLLEGYSITEHEYGTSGEKPGLIDLAPYSTVFWFADDYTTLLASGAMADIKTYLDYGGKLWFAGWKPTTDIRNSVTYPADFSSGDILYDYFKISHVELSGAADSFKTASGLSGYPNIIVDSLKYPASTLWVKTMRYIEALTPIGTGDTIYVMDMKNDGSTFEGRACAVRDSGKTVFFGFPLYFMDKEQVKLAAQKVMAEFGEPYGVSGKPETENRITEIRLSQNAPNPFAKFTVISYQLPVAGQVKLKVYNIAGQLVKTLVNGEQQPGSYTIKWDRKDNHNKQVSAGVYIYHLSTGDKAQSRKMIVLK